MALARNDHVRCGGPARLAELKVLRLTCTCEFVVTLQSKAAAVPVQQTTELSFLQTSSKYFLDA